MRRGSRVIKDSRYMKLRIKKNHEGKCDLEVIARGWHEMIKLQGCKEVFR